MKYVVINNGSDEFFGTLQECEDYVSTMEEAGAAGFQIQPVEAGGKEWLDSLAESKTYTCGLF